MNKKNITLAIIGVVVIGGMVILSKRNSVPKITYYFDNKTTSAASPNVSTEGDKQIIEITAKGGYSPNSTIAKAGKPTILRVKTNNTFDCSAGLRIKSLNYNQTLPATGTTDIEVPAQTAGSTLKALCSMGMYNFSVQFTS